MIVTVSCDALSRLRLCVLLLYSPTVLAEKDAAIAAREAEKELRAEKEAAIAAREAENEELSARPLELRAARAAKT